MSNQKFHKGDLVQIGAMPDYMRHFQGNCRAIVIGSYADQYGGNDHDSYTLFIEGQGETSWYEENQLTLIEADRLGLLAEWDAEEAAYVKEKSDLDWIFAHGKEIVDKPNGATCTALGKIMGIENMWGRNGEGITFYQNCEAVMSVAKPFLLAGDKSGFLALAENP